MWENITKLASLFRKQKINSDSFISKLVYRFLSTFHVACSVLTVSNDYVGARLECDAGISELEHIIAAKCWSQGTWIFPETDEYKNYRFGTDAVAPGVHPPKIKISSSSEPGNIDPADQVYHLLYSFLPYVYLLLALTCHFGRYLWRHAQGSTLPQLVRDLQNTSLGQTDTERIICDSANRFLSDIRQHKSFADIYTLTLIINLCVLVGHFLTITYICNWDFFFGITGTQWMGSLYETWPHSVASIFPQIAKCTMRSFGPGGSITSNDALCYLVLNKVNFLNFTIHWWLLTCIIPLTTYELVDHLIKYISVRRRSAQLRSHLKVHPKSDVGKVIGNLNYGSAFVITLLIKNVPVDFVCKILEEVKLEFDNNRIEVNRRLAGFI